MGSFLGQFVAHDDDDDGKVDGDDEDDYDSDDEDEDDEDGQSQAGTFLGQFVRPRLRAGLSCCGNDGSFDVSGLVPPRPPLLSAKKLKTSCPRNTNFASTIEYLVPPPLLSAKNKRASMVRETKIVPPP